MFSSKPKNQPARLHKVESKPFYVKLCQKLMAIVIMILFVLIVIFLIKVCFAIVPATDSGMYYYHLKDCI